MDERRVGVLGSGDVGKTLGLGFADCGWDVVLGTRNPPPLEAWAAENDADVTVDSFGAAAAHGDLVVLAVRGDATLDAVNAAGPDAFGDAVVLDATNPLAFHEQGPPDLAFGGTDSLGERVQAALPEASVVKCFNTVSHVQMVDPEFDAETPPMLVCGHDADAKALAEDVVVEFGWPGTMDVGDLTAARYLEALVPLWVRVGALLGTWEHAFAAVE